MGEKIRLGIAIKLAASFVFFTIVIILAIGYVSYTVSSNMLDMAAHENLQDDTLVSKSHIDHIYVEESSDASIHAHNPHMIENTVALLNNESIDAYTKLKRDLVSYALRDDDVTALFIIDAVTGRVIVSTDPLYSGTQLSGELFFIEGKSRLFMEINHYFPAQKTISSLVSAPMYHNGSVVAVVTMRLNEHELTNVMVEHEGIGATGTVYLIDESGVEVNNKSNGMGNQPITSEGIKRGLAGATGSSEYVNHRGIPVIGAYRWVPEYNILILVEKELAEVHLPVVKLHKRIITVSISLLIISFVFIILFTNWLTKPIKALTTGMKMVQTGDYSVHIEPMYNDELGDLALSFNGMSEKLQRTTGELESIFTSADAGIILVDIDTNILRVNDWISERFGYVVGGSMRGLFLEKDTICYECPVEMAIKSNAAVIVERVHIENGLEHTYLVTASPVYDSNGIAIGAVLVLADITKRLQMEDELHQYSVKLEKMVEDKTKKLSDKLAEIEKINDVFVGRELVHIETKEKLSEMLGKYQRLEEELRQMQGDADE